MRILAREELINSIIDSMERRAGNVLLNETDGYQSVDDPKSDSTSADPAKNSDNISDAIPLTRIDRKVARSNAWKNLDSQIALDDDCEDVYSATIAICARWKEPKAQALASAWLTDETFDEEVVMNPDMKPVSVLVGIAAAAIVLAIVLIVRRGRRVRLPYLPVIEPSISFQELLRVAESPGLGAEVARELAAKTEEPWNWFLQSALGSLAAADKRHLLEGFIATGGGNVVAVRPNAGQAYDADSMSTTMHITTEDCWVIDTEPTAEEIGFSVDGRIEIPAQVKICTIDWWVLSRPECPVGSAVLECIDDLIPGGIEGAAGWRASWGFSHPEDLRGRMRIDETALERWRLRMVSSLNKHYEEHPERCLTITGSVGEAFELSTMESQNSQPIGDAVVVEVVERDGVAQHGLTCPGGSPLLLAVVITTPKGRTAP